jgi:hypothetical protein
MATITLTEILGGDNIAGSRITINDNFKRVSNAINTLESRLDTSFTPGGSLNVGNALILKYTNPATAQIFTCEATGLFQGGLNVLLNLGVTQSTDIGLDLNVHRNVILDGSAAGGGSFLSQIRSTFTNEMVNEQLSLPIVSAPIVDPQALSGAGSVRDIPSVLGHSVLRVNTSTYTGTAPFDCDTIRLPQVGSGNCTAGQILTVIIDGVGLPSANAMMNGLQIDATNLAPGYTNNIQIGAGSNLTNTLDVTKLAVTLFADAAGWRVLNATQPNTVIPDIIY